jgi:transposase
MLWPTLGCCCRDAGRAAGSGQHTALENLESWFADFALYSIQALDSWIRWGRRSRPPAPVELQRRIVVHRSAIVAALTSNQSNAFIESTNTKIRLLARIASGFHGPHPLIALVENRGA